MAGVRALAVLALAAAAAHAAPGRYPVPPPINLEPTIGVLTIPLPNAETPCITAAKAAGVLRGDGANASCFTAFYSKWLEAAGARVAIIPSDADDATLEALLGSVNGVLFTGGGLENLNLTTPYMVAAAKVYAYAKAANDAGTFYPLHGTCQGFQVLAVLAAQDAGVLEEYAFDAEDLSLPLDWAPAPGGVPSSRLFSDAPAELLSLFSSANITENLHHDGVTPAAFAASAPLSSSFALVSTNLDRAGKAFVSTMEAWRYPITGTQWHPERVQFEHRAGVGLNHTSGAVAAMTWVASHFVEDARRNNNSWASPQLAATYSLYAYASKLVNVGPNLLDGYQAYVVEL